MTQLSMRISGRVKIVSSPCSSQAHLIVAHGAQAVRSGRAAWARARQRHSSERPTTGDTSDCARQTSTPDRHSRPAQLRSELDKCFVSQYL